MARKPSSAPFLKYFFPSYYLRRPRRLGFVSLVFVALVFFFMDRQNQARELEEMSTKLQQLEGIKGGLEAEVDNLKKENAEALKRVETLAQQASSESQVEVQRSVPQQAAKGSTGGSKGDASRGVKADPLILGVGVGSSARKLLPKKEPPPAKAQVLQQATESQTQSQGGAQARGAQGNAQAQEGGSSAGGEDPAKAAAEAKRIAEERRESIRKGMEHAWNGYVTYAWGEDELQPLSKRGVSNFGGMGATIVDSLDTLFIMGLTDQFNKARGWVAQNLDFNKGYTCSVFETTIRVMGGLLSAYDLSGDAMFLEKARQLADRLLPAWKTPSGIPWHYLKLDTGTGDSPGWTGGSTVLADAGTTQVEMIALTQRTNDTRYAEASEGVIRAIDKQFPPDGLCPIYINPQSGTFSSGQITFGAMGDSFYEYLLKVWVQGGKTPVVKRYREMWEQSMKGMMDNLVRHTDNGFTYIAEKHGGGIINKMDHLLCFTGGMLVLGAVDADEELATEYLNLAKGVTKTCYEFYRSQPSKLSGENYNFHSGLAVGQTYNIGRPETVESLFYLWRATKDPIYREWGWQIWLAFEKHCKVDSGYTGLRNVAEDPPPKDDMMQSFFLAETLKYLYLLFSPDDVIPLDRWVFNTEAHPVKIVPRNQPFQASS